MAHIEVIQGHLGNHIVLIERRKWKLQTFFQDWVPRGIAYIDIDKDKN